MSTTADTLETDVSPGTTLVSGTTTFTVSDGTVTSNDDGSSSSRGGSFSEEIVSDDSRVAGTAEGTWETERWEDGTLVQWGAGELTNEDGSWKGDYSGIRTAETGDVLARWWVGTGSYEGLTLFMWITDSSASPWEWSGVVYPGSPPLSSERGTEASVAPSGPSGPSLVTATSGFEVGGGTSTATADATAAWRDWVFAEEITGDDERITGLMEGTWAADVYGQQAPGDTYAQVQWGTGALTNDGGSWQGSFAAMFERENGDVRVQWWTGTGGYEGYTLFMWAQADPTARRSSGSPAGTATYEWTGLIYPGAPPFVETPTAQ